MAASLVLFIIFSYFGLLILVSYFTTRHSNSETFFTANRNSPWYLVAFGMIGTSLSGVTFISIPGEVGNSGWTYLPLVIGNCIGYVVIALILIPLFYKLNLVSIIPGWEPVSVKKHAYPGRFSLLFRNWWVLPCVCS